MFEFLNNCTDRNSNIKKAIKNCNDSMASFREEKYKETIELLFAAMMNIIEEIYASEDIPPATPFEGDGYVSAAAKMVKGGSLDEWIDNKEIMITFNDIRGLRNCYDHSRDDSYFLDENGNFKKEALINRLNNNGYPCSYNMEYGFTSGRESAEKALVQIEKAFSLIINKMTPHVITNRYKRQLAVMVLLDISGSMAGKPIEDINKAPEILKEVIGGDEHSVKDVTELSYISFNNEVKVLKGFHKIGNHENIEKLEAKSKTNMNEALLLAIKNIEKQKEEYKRNYVNKYYRPWLIVLTDGKATDIEKETEAKSAVQNAIKGNHICYYPIAMSNNTDIIKLKEYYPEEYRTSGKDEVGKCGKDELEKFFRWLGNSIKASVSNNTDGISGRYVAPKGIKSQTF